jgi:hypothetical protein
LKISLEAAIIKCCKSLNYDFKSDDALGNHWYGDHVYPVKDITKQGSNTLVIKLTTTLGNYMYSLTDNKDSLKWIKGKKQPLYSMGVLGPVELG